ncbi:unnamed protein product, partial [Scytosiphon promiscuus]
PGPPVTPSSARENPRRQLSQTEAFASSMDQFKKSNASTAASSNDSTAASNNSGKNAPVNASFGRAVSPPGATPPSTHPLGRLSNKISADRGSPSRSIPSKGTPLAATRGAGNGNGNKDGVGSSGGGGGGCGLR